MCGLGQYVCDLDVIQSFSPGCWLQRITTLFVFKESSTKHEHVRPDAEKNTPTRLSHPQFIMSRGRTLIVATDTIRSHTQLILLKHQRRPVRSFGAQQNRCGQFSVKVGAP